MNSLAKSKSTLKEIQDKDDLWKQELVRQSIEDIHPPASTGTNEERYGVVDRGPLRANMGQFSVTEIQDKERETVRISALDDIETHIAEHVTGRNEALVPVVDEEMWKNKLMFVHKFKKTPKHLTWKELGQEIESLDCIIELDDHRPEELYRMNFYFCNKRDGTRDLIWTAGNDISFAEGLTDLLGAVGSCLGRADVHRTIRFDDGKGNLRDLNIRKNSRYTSEVMLAFRPPVTYNMYEHHGENNKWQQEMDDAGLPTWGYHPSLQDPEYRDVDDPAGTYHLALSAHALTFVVLRAIERLCERPLKDFYRPSQLAKTIRKTNTEDVGITHAVMGWLGAEERLYPHFTPLEAIDGHWLGPDAPFNLTSIVNKLREMTYLGKRNPEFHSWLSVRRRDSHLATRNLTAKLLGAGASPLFTPLSHNPTLNVMLPKHQRRRIQATVSLAGSIGMPDETRKIEEIKRIAETGEVQQHHSSHLHQQLATTATTDKLHHAIEGDEKEGRMKIEEGKRENHK